MKRSLKLFTIVLLILLMVSFTTALALWFFLPREQVTTAITSELSKRLNQDITMDTFSVGFYPGVEFVTRNVRIADPSSSREILYAQTVRFDLDLRALFNRRFVVEDITVVSTAVGSVGKIAGSLESRTHSSACGDTRCAYLRRFPKKLLPLVDGATCCLRVRLIWFWCHLTKYRRTQVSTPEKNVF